MEQFFNSLVGEILSWIFIILLTFVAVPQIWKNFKRKSVEGVSWLMFIILFVCMSWTFCRVLTTTSDLVVQFNFGFGAFIALIANCQIAYYKYFYKRKLSGGRNDKS